MPNYLPLADITKLSRITPGEISPDQAVIDYFYNDPTIWLGWMVTQGFFDKLSRKFQLGSRIRLHGLAHNPDQFVSDEQVTLTYKVTGFTNLPHNPPYQEITILAEDEDFVLADADSPNAFWNHNSCVYKFRGIVRYTTKAQAPISGEDYFEFSPIQLGVALSAGDVCLLSVKDLSGFTVVPWTIFNAACVAPDRVNVRWAPFPQTTPGPPGPPAGNTAYLWCEIMNTVPQYFI